jgi:hypothetical protein
VDFSPLKQEIKKDSTVPSGLDSSSHVVAHLEPIASGVNGKENGVNGHERSKDDGVNGAGVS